MSSTLRLSVIPGARARRIVFSSDGITIGLAERSITLSPTEYDLLKTLATDFPNTVSSAELLRLTWGRHTIGRLNYLRLHIHYLRTKLEQEPSSPEVIITEQGNGYRLAVSPVFL